MATWALSAEGGDPKALRLKVRRTDSGPDVGTYQVELTDSKGSRRVAVHPHEHIWDPDAYSELAATLLGTSVGNTGAGAPSLDEFLLTSDTASLRRADAALFGELRRRPLDAGLHEQAALLWAAYTLRESDGAWADDRPFLNGVTAHLALSTALRAGRAPGRHAQIAGAVIDTLLWRQAEAMEALDHIEAASRSADPWVTALRLRITEDPRLIPRGPISRLEKLEGLRAVDASWSCHAAVEKSHTWGLAASPDWARSTLQTCGELPERSTLMQGNLDLQAADAARMIDVTPGTLKAVVQSLGNASVANDHQPARPTAVVPLHVRADAGIRKVASALLVMKARLNGLGLPQESKMFTLEMEQLFEVLPQRPLFAFLETESSLPASLPAESCARIARVIADRPDYLSAAWWPSIRLCGSQSLLAMLDEKDVGRIIALPGTGRLGWGPWETGHRLDGPVIAAARAHAPWDIGLAEWQFEIDYKGCPPGAEVLASYGKTLDYSARAMQSALFRLADHEDEAERLAERVCDLNVERCARVAGRLANLDREDAAMRLWKRALAGSRDPIGLSNELGQYVNILLDQGKIGEGLRVAKLAADVYSELGLFALANTYERVGRFEEAAAEYAKITQRYQDTKWENEFYIRYRQRGHGNLFRDETARAMAEVFPKGLIRKSLADFQREGHHGGVLMDLSTLSIKMRRFGVQPGDFLVAVEGFAVENEEQWNAAMTFSDDPTLAVVVVRQTPDYRPDSKARFPGFIEIQGRYHRWKFGALTRPVETRGDPVAAHPPS